ncbi:Zeaxanthin epoxidase, chloroplastic [Pseudocercospora fuligena]|uniref:Zeaxanthin epoxidase, chloroplastic n=1 Tax=Pseudocercospora fuligena TaxID=685502 RepID=A0A8H6VMQ1_9PEZI|nr:Zeaxanthin epoxidase, chloroplastic [Pseudocercospora fuligena]
MSGDRPVVKFEDGRSSAVDLVVGADGVHSVVKRSIFGEADKSQYAPRFEGYRGVGAFLDMQEMPEIISKQRSVVVTFGSTGSFGYAAAAPLSQCRLGWWSNWPTAEPPISSYTDPNDVRQQLLERHATWKDPVIQRCILRSSTDRVYPLWTTPDLPHWGERGCVLLGDAAHTLQATSGQGAVQALEDSVTFSLLLAYHLSNKVGPDFASSVQVSEAVEAASKGLYELRHQRVRDIRARARNLYFGGRANRNIFWEYLYYCFLFVVTNFPTVGNWAIGSSFVEARDWEPDVEVSRYVDQHS